MEHPLYHIITAGNYDGHFVWSLSLNKWIENQEPMDHAFIMSLDIAQNLMDYINNLPFFEFNGSLQSYYDTADWYIDHPITNAKVLYCSLDADETKLHIKQIKKLEAPAEPHQGTGNYKLDFLLENSWLL